MQHNLFKPVDTIQARFESFHRRHPEIYNQFESIALGLRNRGYKHYSADAILHVVRWHTNMNRTRDNGYKINNNFVSRYARLFQSKHPHLHDFFKTRTLKHG